VNMIDLGHIHRAPPTVGFLLPTVTICLASLSSTKLARLPSAIRVALRSDMTTDSMQDIGRCKAFLQVQNELGSTHCRGKG